MRISPQAKLFVYSIVLCIALAIVTPGSQTTYASVPADVSPSPEPNTPISQPDASSTPQPDASSTPQPDASSTPQPNASSTPQPGASSTPQSGGGNTPQPTNTRATDNDDERKGVEVSLRKTMNTDRPTVGNPIEFTLVVNNTGDETAQDVVVTDPLPAFLQLTGATASRGSVNISGNTVTVTIGSVGAGDTVTIRVSAILLNLPSPPDNRNIAVLTTTSTDREDDNRGSTEIRNADSGSDSSPTAALSPTAAPPTDTPLPGVTTTLVPTPSATIMPPVPSVLPPTGSAGGMMNFWLVLALVGAMSIGFGALLRRRNRHAR